MKNIFFKRKPRLDKDSIMNELVGIIKNVVSGEELQFDDSIEPDTLLGADLALKSIDLVRISAAIQKRYNRQDLPFQDLFMPGGRPVKDLTVSDMVDFLHGQLNPA